MIEVLRNLSMILTMKLREWLLLHTDPDEMRTQEGSNLKGLNYFWCQRSAVWIERAEAVRSMGPEIKGETGAFTLLFSLHYYYTLYDYTFSFSLYLERVKS